MSFPFFAISDVFPFSLPDDGKYAPTRGRHGVCEKHQPCKRNIREATASHEGFFGYLQSKSHVSILLPRLVTPLTVYQLIFSFFPLCTCSLETSLRSYSCLTTGDTIMVAYNSKKYYIDIVETKPSPAVSIIETDCEVDFAPPLDYKEPERQALPVLSDRKRPEPEGCHSSIVGQKIPCRISSVFFSAKLINRF